MADNLTFCIHRTNGDCAGNKHTLEAERAKGYTQGHLEATKELKAHARAIICRLQEMHRVSNHPVIFAALSDMCKRFGYSLWDEINDHNAKAN